MKSDPVAQRPWLVAYHLQEPLQKWLEEGVKAEILEQFPEGEAITWCSLLVVQPKPIYAEQEKGMLEPHMIWATIDLWIPNQYMEWTQIDPGLMVEDFTHTFREYKIVCKLDVKQSYHHVLLHPDSRSVMPFSTPWGNMRPKRLIFGAKHSQDLFNEAMYKRYLETLVFA